MATAAVTHTMVTLTTALASQVNTNYADLVAFLNASVVHKDGAVAMTGELTLSGAPTTNNSAARKLYVDDSVAAAVSPGLVSAYAGTTAPTGWLLCYGQEVSRTTYSALDAIIGTTYGAYTNGSGGVGTTHLRVPDLRGRVAFGKDDMGGVAATRVSTAGSTVDGLTLGAVGGSQLSQSHTHTDSGHAHGPSQGSTFVTRLGNFSAGLTFDTGGYGDASTANASAVISTTHSGTTQNMPPAIMLNYVIKT